MPRKAKETLKSTEKPKAVKAKKTAIKEATTKVKATTKKSAGKKTTAKAKATTTKKAAEKKTTAKTKVTTTKKAAEKKTTAKAKATTTKKPAEKKTTAKAKATTTKRPAEKKTTAKAKATSTKKPATKKTAVKAKVAPTPEYYDLPFHYNQTVVKVLAQTPKTLFVYWDISNEDTENYIKQFGPDFFNNTVPFLRVLDNKNGTSFDIDVDDFANGWYIHVDNSKADYSIELLRKQRPFSEKVIDNAVYITSSNDIETPNDHILFDENLHTVFFKNVKTGEITSKDITNISLLKRIGKIYKIYDLYKRLYKNGDVEEVFDLNNPGSGNPTSTFK